MPTPRMAARQTIHRQNEAAKGTVLPECLNRVLRTRWVEPAALRHVRGNEELVPAHEPDEDETGEANEGR